MLLLTCYLPSCSCHHAVSQLWNIQARIFLLVDLPNFVVRFRVEGTKKKYIKALKMTS